MKVKTTATRLTLSKRDERLLSKPSSSLKKTLSKALTIYAVRRLWCYKDDIFYTREVIRSGDWAQRKLFTLIIPAGTSYEIRPWASGIDHVFTFGKLEIPVYWKDK